MRFRFLYLAAFIACALVSVPPLAQAEATMSVDWSKGDTQVVTLGGNTTLMFSNGRDGGEYVLIIKQDAKGSRLVTWPGTVHWPGGTAPVLTTTANHWDSITFIYNESDVAGTYDALSISQNYN